MAEAKRRLPLWMLKQKAQTEAPGPRAIILESEKKSEDQIVERPVKRKQRKRESEERCEEEGSVKRNQRRNTSNQVSDEFDESEKHIKTSTRGRKKDATQIGEENGERKKGPKRMAVISDDEEDFTVDDLVSIAEEYVNADRDKLNKCTASASTENYPSIDSSKPMPGLGLTKGLLKCSTSKFNIDSSKHALGKNDNLKEDINVPSNVGKTGDPAQDMLNLFLGPLLKIHPPVKEPTIKPVERVTSSSLESSEQTEYKSEITVVEEREILVKKRSSLKDKVATFLS